MTLKEAYEIYRTHPIGSCDPRVMQAQEIVRVDRYHAEEAALGRAQVRWLLRLLILPAVLACFVLPTLAAGYAWGSEHPVLALLGVLLCALVWRARHRRGRP